MLTAEKKRPPRVTTAKPRVTINFKGHPHFSTPAQVATTRKMILLEEVRRQAFLIAAKARSPRIRDKHLAIAETCKQRIAELEVAYDRR